jgi:hypothetical protein
VSLCDQKARDDAAASTASRLAFVTIASRPSVRRDDEEEQLICGD